jgi:hypothetical protein
MHKKNIHPTAPDFQLKRKKRERTKKKEVGLTGGLGSLTLPDLTAGSRRLVAGTRRPWVCETHGFFFPGHGSRSTSSLPSLCPDTSRRPTSQQVDDRSPIPTAGSRRPWVWFFLGFRMIQSQKGLTFLHRF